MASSLALKRFLSSNIAAKSSLSTFLRPSAAAAASSKHFNTNALRHYDQDGDRSSDVDHRPHRHDFLSDVVLDPFSPTRSLSQVLNLMDHFMEAPFLSAAARGGGGVGRGWEARETEDALHLRVDMPGLGKEDVKVSVEQNTLTIRGEEGGSGAEGAEEGGGDGSSSGVGGRRRYVSRIDLPEKLYRADQIKAEMKNGVLKVVVPKVKEDERSDVFQVNVD